MSGLFFHFTCSYLKLCGTEIIELFLIEKLFVQNTAFSLVESGADDFSLSFQLSIWSQKPHI